MEEGRAQLAMDVSNDRKERDSRAIRWVIDSLTEDGELEPFIFSIPGTLSSTWGKKVWETVAEGEASVDMLSNADQALALVLSNSGQISQHMATPRSDGSLRNLGRAITRLLKTCTAPGILPAEDHRRKRANACVDAALSLVLSIKREWEWFAESEVMAQTLLYLGDIERIRGDVPLGSDSTTVARRTCMSIIAVRKMLQTPAVHDAAQRIIARLADVRGEPESDKDLEAAKTAEIIDRRLGDVWYSASTLHDELSREVEPDKMEERLHEIMLSNKDQIAELEYTWNTLGWAEEVDDAVISLVGTMVTATGGVLNYLPHIVLRWQTDPRRIPEMGMCPIPTYLMPQLIPPRLLIQRLWVCPWLFRSISASGWGVSMYRPKTLGEFSAPELRVTELRELMATQMPIKTQLCRVQDLRDGGLVYFLELFITAIRSIKAASQETSRPLFIRTFQHIIADWKAYPCAIWTQQLLVNLLRQVLPRDHDPPTDEVPGYIIDEFLSFVAKVLAEKKGPHVNEAILMMEEYINFCGGAQEIARMAISTISNLDPPDPLPGGLLTPPV
ncbi:hypothetical protein F5148DRAFT_1200860 [Russula earlei]|uniref:Uncharacterized protein n=1 Tax=Russula earlei TaxID=71964 RepID=A0ACC0UA44_9AGAM|nr:hypothetical protein F5148DRAFT_1200860 [Russula earlei]